MSGAGIHPGFRKRKTVNRHDGNVIDNQDLILKSLASATVVARKKSIMAPQRILGFALLVFGVVLLFIGMNSSHSMMDQLSNTFTGRFTDSTNWYILGGTVMAVVGLLIAIYGPRGNRT